MTVFWERDMDRLGQMNSGKRGNTKLWKPELNSYDMFEPTNRV
jgi:hypothetical protein